MRKFFLGIVAIAIQMIGTVALAQSAEVASTTDQSLFRFIINRGEIFSPTAPGELTELTLSGYFCVQDRWAGQLTPAKSANSISLTGKATLNPYSKHLQTNVVASLPMPYITSPTGLFLMLIVDGIPMNVQLPYVNENDNWPTGYEYTYSVTVEGRSLIISGVTYTAMQNNAE